jgi:hypothetical protein
MYMHVNIQFYTDLGLQNRRDRLAQYTFNSFHLLRDHFQTGNDIPSAGPSNISNMSIDCTQKFVGRNQAIKLAGRASWMTPSIG